MAMTELTEQEKKKKLLSTGNTEIDKKMADGLPVHSLNLIEGANDTGKSVLTQQITWGGLNQGHTFAIFTTENTIKSFLSQMESLSTSASAGRTRGRTFPRAGRRKSVTRTPRTRSMYDFAAWCFLRHSAIRAMVMNGARRTARA